MKRLFIILLCLLTLCSCTAKEPANDIDLVTTKVDMSGYRNMLPFDHQFVGIDPSEFIRVFQEKGTGIFYFGYADCPYCNEAIPYLNEVAKENDIKIHYIDVYSDQYNFFEYFETVKALLEEILPVEDGEVVMYTPTVVAIRNGEIVGHHTSLSERNVWEEYNPSDKAINELKKDYQKLIDAIR